MLGGSWDPEALEQIGTSVESSNWVLLHLGVNPAPQELHTQLQHELQSQHKTLAASQAITGFSEQSVATEMHKRSVIIHGRPSFFQKKATDDNLWYPRGLCNMTPNDIQSVTNHLLTSSVGFLRITFLREAQAKLFFQTFRQGRRYFRSKHQSADSQLRIERDISIHERIEKQPLLALVDVYTKEATDSGQRSLILDPSLCSLVCPN